MKNHNFAKNFTAIVLVTIFLLSCKKTETTIVQKEPLDSTATVENKFTVDSVSISDSIKLSDSITANYEAKILVFPQITNKSVLDSIYSNANLKLTNFSKESLKNALIANKNEYFKTNKNSVKDYLGNFKQTWEQNSDMNLFQKDNNLLTLEYTGYGFSGGAHGYSYQNYKIYDLKNNKTLQLKDIFTTTDPKIWNSILMKNFLSNKQYTKELLFDKEIPLNNNFYYNDKGVHFVYGQYEIAPYAAGIIDITLPYQEISKYLQPEFKAEIGK